MRREAAQEYEFSMRFVSKDIREFIENKNIEEAALLERFPNRLSIPYHFCIAAYDYQDLAIVQVLEHVKECEQWNVELTITMSDRTDMYEGSIIVNLIYAELSGDFPLGDSRQPTYKSLRPFDLVS